MEFFAWRAFRNRRELAALAGLVGTPYNSGDSEREAPVNFLGRAMCATVLIDGAFRPKPVRLARLGAYSIG
jgi:transposase